MVMMTGSRKPPSYCLFLGDLSLFCKEEDLEREFAKFGEITALRIKRSKETHKNLCYGFVEYSRPSAAVQAMNELDGKIMFGRPLRVRWASSITSKTSRFAHKQKSEESKPVSIYVAFTCFHLERLVNEETLRDVFSRFGPVVDVAIKQSQTDTLANRQKGYAFISFPDDDTGVEAALQAAREMIDTTIDNINFRVEVSRVLEYRLQSNSQSPPDNRNHAPSYQLSAQTTPMSLPAPMIYSYDLMQSVPSQQYYPQLSPPQLSYNPSPTPLMNMNMSHQAQPASLHNNQHHNPTEMNSNFPPPGGNPYNIPIPPYLSNENNLTSHHIQYNFPTENYQPHVINTNLNYPPVPNQQPPSYFPSTMNNNNSFHTSVSHPTFHPNQRRYHN